jgi:hypothetical protein
MMTTSETAANACTARRQNGVGTAMTTRRAAKIRRPAAARARAVVSTGPIVREGATGRSLGPARRQIRTAPQHGDRQHDAQDHQDQQGESSCGQSRADASAERIAEGGAPVMSRLDMELVGSPLDFPVKWAAIQEEQQPRHQPSREQPYQSGEPTTHPPRTQGRHP